MGDDAATPARGGSGSGARERTAAVEQQELEELRLAVTRAYHLGTRLWPIFFALDLYVVYVVVPTAPVWPFAAVRVLVLGAFVAIYYAMRERFTTVGRIMAFEIAVFALASAGIAFMALFAGGPSSHYVQGVSIVLLVQAASVPAPIKRAILVALVTAAPYPIVLICAGLVDRSVHDMWLTPGTTAAFSLDLIFVLSTASIGAVASHLVWAARRQVYEARKLGRYRLKMRIGGGGMGDVWMAWDEQRRSDVALKVLAPSASERAGAVARFEREARAVASLESPHTVRVFDYGASDDGVRYLAMELLDGADLAQLVAREGPLAAARAIDVARQACESLDEAHARGIVHRDVKPENLFVSRSDGRDFVRLLDFGIAKVSVENDDATLTQAGSIGGTPAYMSPEACAGQSTDARSDLYSIGAVLHFLVTGAPPFVADSPAAVMTAHVRDEPPRAGARGAAVSPELEEVILRCLRKRPADRFPSAAALSAALARCPDVAALSAATTQVSISMGPS